MKTNEIIFIAGPAASGKTFLLNLLRKSQCPRLRKQLGINDVNEWQLTQMKDLIGFSQTLDKVVVHCDLYNGKTILKQIENAINNSQSVKALTLCLPQKTLLARNRKRIWKNIRWVLFDSSKRNFAICNLKMLYKRQKINRNEQMLLSVYTEWFKLLKKHNIDNCWISSEYIDDPEATWIIEDSYSEALKTIQSNI